MSAKKEGTYKMIKLLAILVVVLFEISCTQSIPKPHAYIRLNLPDHSYTALEGNYPYCFAYSKHANMVKKDGYREVNIEYSKLNCTIFLTYKNIDNNFRELSKDGHELAYSHSSKADAISENNYSNPQKRVWCVLYSLEGNVASPLQFVATDSTKNWIRGAVYINSVPNQDSLAPMIEYLKKDVTKLIETLQWEH